MRIKKNHYNNTSTQNMYRDEATMRVVVDRRAFTLKMTFDLKG